MTPREAEDHRRDSNNWHLDKKVPVSLIIAMIAQIVAVVWAIADIKKDTELNKQAIEQLREADKFLMSETQRNLQIIQGHYARLEAKLDRLIERESVTDKK
jgi:hypothetical protein